MNGLPKLTFDQQQDEKDHSCENHREIIIESPEDS